MNASVRSDTAEHPNCRVISAHRRGPDAASAWWAHKAGHRPVAVQLRNFDGIASCYHRPSTPPPAGPGTTAPHPGSSHLWFASTRLVHGSPLSISRRLRLPCNLKRPVQSPRQVSSSRSNSSPAGQRDSPSGIYLHPPTRDSPSPKCLSACPLPYNPMSPGCMAFRRAPCVTPRRAAPVRPVFAVVNLSDKCEASSQYPDPKQILLQTNGRHLKFSGSQKPPLHHREGGWTHTVGPSGTFYHQRSGSCGTSVVLFWSQA